ncbi:hypothetical protein BJ875DRAFT_151302 [Amylocarpus encephaloides]|uniref:Uncharacterized protein n=1 Tax=Amylocarpus encephaloides TaxID=45428 RepID=A0A9P8C326_9HELO|nr:hypothetical protein BJ875DRAFT_151302 [Amylocarpus encephaloides]
MSVVSVVGIAKESAATTLVGATSLVVTFTLSFCLLRPFHYGSLRFALVSLALALPIAMLYSVLFGRAYGRTCTQKHETIPFRRAHGKVRSNLTCRPRVSILVMFAS